jgi:putative ABC transport system permease protein
MSGRPVRSIVGLALRCTRAWWPQLAALAAASGIVSATIAGALGVGDAITRGLLDVARGRLARIEAAVIGEDFFRAELAREIGSCLAESDAPAAAVPAIVLGITVEAAGRDGQPRRAARATLLACDDPAAFGFAPPPPPLANDTVFVNGPLAEVLGLKAGDPVVARAAERSAVPADSPLGRRSGDSMSRRLTVAAVLPRQGIGEFSLRPTQVTSGLAVTTLATAQAILRRDAAANVVLCVSAAGDREAAEAGGRPRPADMLAACLRPTLADLGLSLAVADAADERPTPRLTSRRLLLDRETDRGAAAVLRPLGGQPSLAFLANALSPAGGGGSIPYSTVLGIESTSLPAGDLVDDAGRLLPMPGPDEILVDRWVADDLAAQGRPLAVGDDLEIKAFLPETLHGRVEERTHRLRVAGIAAMRGAAVSRGLVPEVEGITDEASIADWDPPFPFDRSRVRSTPPHDEDERYWRDYRATPKAFVALATARRIAGSRFGETTAWHVPADRVPDLGATAAAVAAEIRPDRAGVRVMPLAREAVAAARGSTPFGGLFLALSLVLVAAGLLLEWLLFALLVTAHRRDVGVLSAVGWPTARVARLLVATAAVAVIGGAVIGLGIAPVWSAALVAGLGSAWNASVSAGSRQVFGAAAPTLRACWPGAVAAAGISLAAVWWAARRAARLAPGLLLRRAGGTGPRLRRGRRELRSLVGLAWRGVISRWSRAASIAAIVGLAEFLVVVVSAFALRPVDRPDDRSSPTGGWTHIASFAEPTGIDPCDPETAARLGLSSDEQTLLARSTIARLRSNGGDDADCTNLYAAGRPTLLGVGSAFIERGGFRFVAHAPLPKGVSNPWSLLRPRDASPAAPLPAILDQATAQWGLKLGGVGARFTLPGDAGEPHAFEIVGLLEPGILQGAVIVAEESFTRAEPRISGYGMALVDAHGSATGAATRAIAAAWADASPAVQATADRLRRLYAVQNTFLAGFQALGTLGLLLGTLGVAAVQMQGVYERLGQLAVLRAIGFTLARVRQLILLETIAMVAAGVLAGAGCGLAVLAPLVARGRAVIPWGWLALSGLACLVAAMLAGLAAARGDRIPVRPVAD